MRTPSALDGRSDDRVASTLQTPLHSACQAAALAAEVASIRARIASLRSEFADDPAAVGLIL